MNIKEVLFGSKRRVLTREQVEAAAAQGNVFARIALTPSPVREDSSEKENEKVYLPGHGYLQAASGRAERVKPIPGQDDADRFRFRS